MVDVLHPDQVWDVSRTCFFSGLKAAGKEKHMGEQVYEDGRGYKFIIVPRKER